MIHRFLLCMFLFTLVASAQPAELNEESNSNRMGESWDWSYGAEEGGGSSYLGVDIADVSPERLGELKLKEEHGAEVTMVDQDAPAGKAGLHEHDVIVSLNGTAVESAAQLRRMIKETPPGRVVSLGISRDGQPLTIKLQLADRHKSMGWDQNGKFEMPKMPKMPDLPEFDLPVSVVVVHSADAQRADGGKHYSATRRFLWGQGRQGRAGALGGERQPRGKGGIPCRRCGR